MGIQPRGQLGLGTLPISAIGRKVERTYLQIAIRTDGYHASLDRLEAVGLHQLLQEAIA